LQIRGLARPRRRGLHDGCTMEVARAAR